jgi:hypothetical protein
MAELVEIDPGADRAQRVRRIIGRSLQNHLREHGDEIAGFAFVTWDMRGEATSGYMTEVGPIGESLMPAFVKDALQRHLAVVLVERTQSMPITGD